MTDTMYMFDMSNIISHFTDNKRFLTLDLCTKMHEVKSQFASFIHMILNIMCERENKYILNRKH